MKKIYISVITVITIACIIGGMAYQFGRWGVFGDEWSDTGNGIYQYEEFDKDDFQNVKVEAEIMDLAIKTGSSFSLEYKANKESLVPAYEIKGNTLIINQKQKSRNFSWGINVNNCSLTLTIPEGTELGDIGISTNVGDVEISRILAQSFDIDSDVGDCMISDCKFGRTELKSDVGDITVKSSELGTVTGGSDVGDIYIGSCSFGNLDIESDVGDVDIVSADSLEDYDINLSSDIGGVYLNTSSYKRNFTQSGNSGYKVKITTSVGDISVEY